MEPKYGIIGCGMMSGFYCRALSEIENAIVYVADIDAERARQLGEPLNARCSTDYMDTINDPEVTAVIVLAHGRFHKEICLAAIAAGKDVICEKTLSNSADEARQIAKAAADKDVVFFTAYMKRFFPAVEKAKTLTESLGVIYSSYIRSYQFWGNLFEPPEEFSGELWRSRYGGGVIKCAGSHLLDLTLHLLGRPKRLYANVDYAGETQLDRKGVAMFEYESGATAVFEATGHCLSKIGYCRNNWDERIEINGTRGRLDIYLPTWDKPLENAALLVHYDEDTKTSVEYRFDAIDPFRKQMEYFHKCLSDRKQEHPSVIDGMNVDILISAMTESSSKKMPVELKW